MGKELTSAKAPDYWLADQDLKKELEIQIHKEAIHMGNRVAFLEKKLAALEEKISFLTPSLKTDIDSTEDYRIT